MRILPDQSRGVQGFPDKPADALQDFDPVTLQRVK